MNRQSSPAAQVTTACLLEATARKPGNVHPGARFADSCYDDFVASALAIGPALATAPQRGVGRAILTAVGASRHAAGTNTHLGTILLLAPLVAVPTNGAWFEQVPRLLDHLGPQETRHVYEAIRVSAAGGLGRPHEADVADPPPALPLVATMRMAAERDLVARQYVNGFTDVRAAASWIEEEFAAQPDDLEAAIVTAFLRLMREHPDSLIARKCGDAVARDASIRAAQVLECESPAAAAALRADLDRWLREDGNRRNPGTSADLIAAGLFVLLREGRLDLETARADMGL